MANKVFANNMEVACKSAAGMTICAMPDVCMTPPENPATPPGVPVPYPNTGMASDTTEGSKTVKISNKEVCLKNKSYFKTSYGDEAGCAAKKGVITSKNKGKVYFQAWSSDVKFEGENAVRHFDITTNNHASSPGDTPPWTYIDSLDIAPATHPCKDEIDKAQEACKGAKSTGDGKRDCSECEGDCNKRMQCILVPKSKDKKLCCAPQNTGHHLVPEHSCHGVIPGYNGNDAPTACAGGWSWHRNDRSGIPDSEKTHPALHEIQDSIERKVLRIVGVKRFGGRSKDRPWKYQTVRNIGLSAHRKTFGDHCSYKCMGSQLDNFHLKNGVTKDTPLKAKEYGNKIPSNDRGYNNWRAKLPGLPPS